MIETRRKSYRDYSVGEWILLVFSAIVASLLNPLIPPDLRLGNLSMRFWVTMAPVILALCYVYRPAKAKELTFNEYVWKSWISLLLMPGCYFILPALALLAGLLTACYGGHSFLFFFHIWLTLAGIYFASAGLAIVCQRLGLQPIEILNLPPSVIGEQLRCGKPVARNEISHTLILQYQYHDALQLCLASLGELKHASIKSIDDNLGRITAISSQKLRSQETIALQLASLSHENTQVFISVNSVDSDNNSSINLISTFLEEFNGYKSPE